MLKKISIRMRFALVALVLFLVSLWLPAISDPGGVGRPWLGYHVLTMGWGAVASGVFAWLANLLAPLSLVYEPESRMSPALALVAALLGLQTLSRPQINSIDTWSPMGVPLSGYYVWQAALFCVLVGAVLGYRAARRGGNSANSP
jgi:Na+/H+-dicarboxylate symporter